MTASLCPSPLDIALMVNLYPPYIIGGNEVLARDVVEALRERGHRVHVLTGKGTRLPRDGFTHGVLNLDLDFKEELFFGESRLTASRVIRRHLYDHASYQGVLHCLRLLQPDIVIAWNLFMASAAPLVAARRYGAPLVAQPADKWLLYCLKDLGALVPAGKIPRHQPAIKTVRRLVQPILYRLGRPDYVLAVSEFIRMLHLKAGFPATQSMVFHPGVPTESFPEASRDFPTASPWRLIFSGQLCHAKGPQVAIEAMALLQKRHPPLPVTLDIYGAGEQHFVRSLRQQIDSAELSATVRIHGFLPRHDLAKEYARHQAFLFCSVWDEPFSCGLLEAMSTGIPVVATATGGTLEAIRDGANGLLVAPNDPHALSASIERLLTNPELCRRIGSQAASDVRSRWTFNQYVDRLEECYFAIAAGHRPGRPLVLSDPRA